MMCTANYTPWAIFLLLVCGTGTGHVWDLFASTWVLSDLYWILWYDICLLNLFFFHLIGIEILSFLPFFLPSFLTLSFFHRLAYWRSLLFFKLRFMCLCLDLHTWKLELGICRGFLTPSCYIECLCFASGYDRLHWSRGMHSFPEMGSWSLDYISRRVS